ncbi:MAG: helix-turn-helix domain-containing protein [Erysipelotrichaceae bacterium]|nr:helix-turn-helix domain-containing protein [Erysipelotrichaceae bacterium]
MSEKEIEERKAILEEHNRLLDEYNRLCDNKNLLTSQEWQRQEEKKKSILLKIDRCKAMEQSFDDDSNKSDPSIFGLQMLKMEEVQTLLNCSYESLRNFIEIGMLKPIKTGKCYMFIQSDIAEFQQKYKGYDLSNYQKALLVYNEVLSNG